MGFLYKNSIKFLLEILKLCQHWINMLTFIFITFTLNTKYWNNHNDDYNGGGCQSHHKPCLSIKRFLLQISILEVKFAGRQHCVIRVHWVRYSVFIVADHSELVGGWRKQGLVADGEFLHRSTRCFCYHLPARII